MIRKTFFSWREASEFYHQSAKKVGSGNILGLKDQKNGSFLVYESKIAQDGHYRRDRSGESNRKTGGISDEMSPTEHPCSGKVFTSSKKFRDETRAHGCSELGNDKPRIKRDVPNIGDPRPYLSHVYDKLSRGERVEQ